MIRPPFEVADIIRQHGDRFIETYAAWLTGQHLRVLRALARCRTAVLGGHLDRCARCDHRAISYNSCRNRHCPKCLTHARDQWLAKRQQELLPVGYHHVVFTLPHELSWLALQNKTVVYDLLFRASAATLLEVAADAKHLGAAIGFLSVLHTWGQNLLHHPHVHCVIPVGGLSRDGASWVHPRYPFFLPVKVLSRVFRGKFVAGLRRAFRRGYLSFPGRLHHLTDAPAFRAFVRRLFRHDWVVYAKPPFGGPGHVLQYLARYTHRVAISNHRILNVAENTVTFQWKDYRHGSQEADHDGQRRRISPSILLTRPAEGLRPDPLLWVSRTSTPRPRSFTLSASACVPPMSGTRNIPSRTGAAIRLMALSPLWRGHGRDRTAPAAPDLWSRHVGGNRP